MIIYSEKNSLSNVFSRKTVKENTKKYSVVLQFGEIRDFK